MEKAPDALRTISEVSEALGTAAHVLRFWESKFPQIKPIKRAGGRRYYRPSDVALLAGAVIVLLALQCASAGASSGCACSLFGNRRDHT